MDRTSHEELRVLAPGLGVVHQNLLGKMLSRLDRLETMIDLLNDRVARVAAGQPAITAPSTRDERWPVAAPTGEQTQGSSPWEPPITASRAVLRSWYADQPAASRDAEPTVAQVADKASISQSPASNSPAAPSASDDAASPSQGSGEWEPVTADGKGALLRPAFMEVGKHYQIGQIVYIKTGADVIEIYEVQP